MNSSAARSAAAAAVGVTAIGLAAATLTSASTTGGQDPGLFGSGGGLIGESGSGILPLVRVDPSSFSPPPWFALVLALLAVVGVVLSIVYLLRYGHHLPRVLLAALLGVALLWLLSLVPFPRLGAGVSLAESQPSPPGGGGGGATGVTTPIPPSLVVVLALGLGLLGATAALVRTTGDSTGWDDESEPSSPDVAAVGRAAGRAADRIEGSDADAGVDNEVFRAWREMTRRLDVPDPETTTAGEFADAAIEAGMNADDVRELTGLFEEVRYGGRAASAERERRAVETLRRIEAAYADGP